MRGERFAVVIADRRRIAAKVVQPQPSRAESGPTLNEIILTAIRKAFAEFNAKQATNEGTTTTTTITTNTTEGK